MAGILASTAVAVAAGYSEIDAVVGLPESMTAGMLAADFGGLLRQSDLFAVIFVILFVDLFDTVGTLVGVTERAGLSVDGKLPRARAAFLADAMGSVAGGALGTSTVTSYVEKRRGSRIGRPDRIVGDRDRGLVSRVPVLLSAAAGRGRELRRWEWRDSLSDARAGSGSGGRLHDRFGR